MVVPEYQWYLTEDEVTVAAQFEKDIDHRLKSVLIEEVRVTLSDLLQHMGTVGSIPAGVIAEDLENRGGLRTWLSRCAAIKTEGRAPR